MASQDSDEQKVYLLRLDDLTYPIRDSIAEREDLEYFLSQDWSPEFYRAQAKLGFIAITYSQDDFTVLMPQLQSAYALLDWENLHISRKVRHILNSSRMESENIRLHISPDPAEVLQEIQSAWNRTSWLTDDYREVIQKLASREEQQKDRGFRTWGVTLTAGKEQNIVAGELGYTIGQSYTSLTGFFKRDNKTYNNFGKLQMVLLARELEARGIQFWNLGHPYMAYKTDLGAKILPRIDFLKRWDKAVPGPSPDLNTGFPVDL